MSNFDDIRQEILSQISAKKVELRELNTRRDLIPMTATKLLEKIDIQRFKLRNEIANLSYELNQLPIGINKLPPELIRSIFKSMNFETVLQCQLVSRRWFDLVVSLRPQRLIFYDKTINRLKRWSFTDELYNSKLMAPLSNLVEVTSSFNTLQMIYNLKKLKIDNMHDFFDESIKTEPSLTSISFVNLFGQLEILEIGFLKLKDSNARITLVNLKQMEVTFIRTPIKLNTPNLFEFRTYYGAELRLVNFLFPHHITHLHMAIYDYSVNIGYRFSNLTALYILNNVTANILVDIPNLTEIYVHNDLYNSVYTNLQKETVEFLYERNRLKKNTKIVFYGFVLTNVQQLHELIKLEDGNRLSDFVFNEKNLIQLLLNNWNKLIYYDFVRRLNYHDTYEDIVRLPPQFTERFVYIHEVFINKRVHDPLHLIEFLKGLKRLDTLKIANAQLNCKIFYDKLPSTCTKLLYLSFMESNCMFENFNFVLKLKNPVVLKTNQEIPLTIVQQVFDKYQRDISLSFRYKEQLIELTREPTWCMSIEGNDYPTYFDNLDSVFAFLISLDET